MTKCSLGVGCEEYGVCYADAHGDPDQCGKHTGAVDPYDNGFLACVEATVKTPDGCMAQNPHPAGSDAYFAFNKGWRDAR